MLPKNDLDFNKQVDERIRKIVPQMLAQSAFTDHKVTDTPTDAYNVVPRHFVTNNGTVANRPKSSVATVGQPYYATDTLIPMTYTAEGWRNGVGSIVALNN